MKRVLLVAVLVLAVLALSACAAGPNSLVRTPGPDGDLAGFWRGLWHGVIAPVTFIVSLFTDSVNFYEVHNNGNWYDLGFVLGTGLLGGGGIMGSRSRRRED